MNSAEKKYRTTNENESNLHDLNVCTQTILQNIFYCFILLVKYNFRKVLTTL